MSDQDPVAALLAACEPFIDAANDLRDLQDAWPMLIRPRDYACDRAAITAGAFRRLAEAAARLRAAPDGIEMPVFPADDQQKGGDADG